jgi:uncharacterized protein (DUF1697 family)
MPDLAAHFASLGCTDITTVLASGNVIFRSRHRSVTGLEEKLSDHLAKQLGYAVPTRVRTATELQDIVDHAPLGDLFTDLPHASTQVTFFPDPLPEEEARRLEKLRSPTDRVRVVDRELYWRCGTKLTDSPLWQDAKTNPHNHASGTTRNLQTLHKILSKLPI